MRKRHHHLINHLQIMNAVYLERICIWLFFFFCCYFSPSKWMRIHFVQFFLEHKHAVDDYIQRCIKKRTALRLQITIWLETSEKKNETSTILCFMISCNDALVIKGKRFVEFRFLLNFPYVMFIFFSLFFFPAKGKKRWLQLYFYTTNGNFFHWFLWHIRFWMKWKQIGERGMPQTSAIHSNGQHKCLSHAFVRSRVRLVIVMTIIANKLICAT